MQRARMIMRFLMAAFYVSAGYAHLTKPAIFLAIVPDWVPAPDTTILITGLCEIAGGIGLCIPRLRKLAGTMLALYAVCVYPANIKHAFEHIAIGGNQLGWAFHVPRLALQPVLVWWALFCSGVIAWPFRNRTPAVRDHPDLGSPSLAGPPQA